MPTKTILIKMVILKTQIPLNNADGFIITQYNCYTQTNLKGVCLICKRPRTVSIDIKKKVNNYFFKYSFYAVVCFPDL